ncbi:MAG: ATP-binding cassette domain-containing protein [Candidatus Lokiarchaeota archaeon]|nr:ATP-binding cassette domain-containing protein [Candidatus Lokiarchaeota archaeon]
MVSFHSDSNQFKSRHFLNDHIIEIKGLEKDFDGFKAVDGISFKVRRGELFSLLGPNGAGKSTTIRMLTTVLKPTSGDAYVADYSLVNEKNKIKPFIGVCPQENVIFEALTAEDNVAFVGRMHGMRPEDIKTRSQYLLENMNIAGRKKASKSFSGGMKRRLNLAMSLVHQPHILFLDEPTAGLDPQARRLVWDFIKELKNTGMTIVLTTHDMVEADALSDHVAIMDHGKIIALGTLEEVKRGTNNGNILDVSFSSKDDLLRAKSKIGALESVQKTEDKQNNKLSVFFTGGVKSFKLEILPELESFKTLHFREDTLEDVFLKLTGRGLRDN